MRSSGILLHISSLPSPYGIGTLGKAAYDFVNFLKAAGQTYWQILPIGPTSYGDSPYQSFSCYAGNPYFIDLDLLKEEGLLKSGELSKQGWGAKKTEVDYGLLYEKRFDTLRIAVDRFLEREKAGAGVKSAAGVKPGAGAKSAAGVKPGAGVKTVAGAKTSGDRKTEYECFKEENSFWLENYALFMTLKYAHGGKAFIEWDEKYKCRDAEAMRIYKEEHPSEIEFWMVLQFFFFAQWKKLKSYANAKGIQIIGDIPIYVAYDSCDVWANPELFQLRENLEPIEVSGCPPDGFSADGQLWGNPLYNYELMKKDNYAWWVGRISYMLKIYDVLRIDHFRGFDAYYAIPFGEKTARNGRWKEGPGMDLFRAVEKSLGKQNIIAEDLGFLTDSVRKLLSDSGFPGMKVLEFAFDRRDASSNAYLPHNIVQHCVAYSGTHDNDTLVGWLKTAERKDVRHAKEYLRLTDPKNYHWEMMQALWMSVADTTIVQGQDILGLGSKSRMNTPSTLGGNWTFRVKEGVFTKELAKKLKNQMILYGRMP